MENNGYNFNFDFVNEGAPLVSISSLCMSFNSLSKKLLGNPDRVNIGFDSEKLTICVKAFDLSSNIPSFAFRKSASDWVRISCKDFISYLRVMSGIDFNDKSKQFIARYDEEINGLLITVTKEFLKNKPKISEY